MTVRATGKDDLLRWQTRRRLDFNVRDIATGSSEHWEHLASRSSHLHCIQQHSVQAKMTKFQMNLTTLEVTRCSTCSEAFPGLHLLPGSTDCARCARDKHTPKLNSMPMAIIWILAPSQHSCRLIAINPSAHACSTTRGQ